MRSGEQRRPIHSADELRVRLADLLDIDEPFAHGWLHARFNELYETALNRSDDQASVQAAEILCDLAGLPEAERAFTIESNGVLRPSPETVQARAAAVCRRLAEFRELTDVEKI